MFIKEINKCSMLPHEEWFETLENTSSLYLQKDYQPMVSNLLKIHKKSKIKPQSMYEKNFKQKYWNKLVEAEEYLHEFIDKNDFVSLSMAWQVYLEVYNQINEDYEKFENISLEYVSTYLANFKNSKISLPGSYYENNYVKYNKIFNKNQLSKLQDEKIQEVIRIQKMGTSLKVFNSKQHPRRLSMIGTNDKEYLFLLKGHEDLHQDERAMQLFNLVNTILANDKDTCNKNLYINTYSIFPLSNNTGIIGWVPNCDTLHQLIKEKREMNNVVLSSEHRKIYKLCQKFESLSLLGKIEIFQESIQETNGAEISNIIWIKSKNCETWLNRRTNYSRTLAVMSMVGYILGLGDRHPSNLMMGRNTGKIIHIDFGDCFEVAMKRENFPEKVPFRLTRMLVKALEVSGIEGTFRIISEKVMSLLRENKDSLLAILGSFLYDPLISFRLMIPMIMKLKDEKKSNKKVVDKKKEETRNINFNKNINFNSFRNNEMGSVLKGMNNKISSTVSKMSKIASLNNPKRFEENRGSIYSKDIDKNVAINEEKEKNERKKMQNDERQIFNLYEDNGDINNDELNDIAQIVLERIHDKLSGTDFYSDIEYDVKRQVNELIMQATSYENLAQSYLGWCPFW